MVHRYEFDWDPNNASSNVMKHKVAFDDAMTMFADPLALSRMDDDSSAIEERWITVGASLNGNLLLIVHTSVELSPDRTLVRIISARKASKHERRHYEQTPKND